MFGWLALANAALDWLFAFAGELEDAIEVGGCSLLFLAAIAVGCAIVAMIILACRRTTHRGFGRAILAVVLAGAAVVGFFGPLILLLSQLRMF